MPGWFTKVIFIYDATVFHLEHSLDVTLFQLKFTAQQKNTVSLN